MRHPAKGFDALGASATNPLTDGTFGDAQSIGDIPLFPALLFERPGTKTTTFVPILRRRRVCCHISYIGHLTKILNQTR